MTAYTRALAILFIYASFVTMPICVKAQGQDRWWQREVSHPSPSERINPAYLKKKRELEQAWDTLRRDIQAQRHFQSLGQKTPAINNAISSSRNKVNRLEHELSQIPQYLPLSPPPETRINQSVNVTPHNTVIIPEAPRSEAQGKQTPFAKPSDAGVIIPVTIDGLQQLYLPLMV